tara:strand:- start:252 stop:482 length:231 start_codon:yes stop_codon:yes gene_type:complete
MTNVRILIEQGLGISFEAETTNAIHGLIAIPFLTDLDANLDIILWLKRIGISVLIMFWINVFELIEAVNQKYSHWL